MSHGCQSSVELRRGNNSVHPIPPVYEIIQIASHYSNHWRVGKRVNIVSLSGGDRAQVGLGGSGISCVTLTFKVNTTLGSYIVPSSSRVEHVWDQFREGN